MIIGTHVVMTSTNPEADHAFFRDVLKLNSVAAGGGYVIYALPASEASIHETDSKVPHHELYLMCDNVNDFVDEMNAQNIKCGPVDDQGWGIVVQIKLPSGAPIQVYEPRHEGP